MGKIRAVDVVNVIRNIASDITPVGSISIVHIAQLIKPFIIGCKITIPKHNVKIVSRPATIQVCSLQILVANIKKID